MFRHKFVHQIGRYVFNSLIAVQNNQELEGHFKTYLLNDNINKLITTSFNKIIVKGFKLEETLVEPVLLLYLLAQIKKQLIITEHLAYLDI